MGIQLIATWKALSVLLATRMTAMLTKKGENRKADTGLTKDVSWLTLTRMARAARVKESFIERTMCLKSTQYLLKMGRRPKLRQIDGTTASLQRRRMRTLNTTTSSSDTLSRTS